MGDDTRASGNRRRGGGVLRAALFGLWFVGISIPLAALAVHHNLPFARRAPVPQGTDASRTPLVRHILAADCPCSGAVADRLQARVVDAGAREDVWIVGPAVGWQAGLGRAGYRVVLASADDVTAQFGVVGAPFLIVYDAQGVERYAGGYAPRRPRVPADVQVDGIVAAVRSGAPPAPFPSYGCVVGDSLRRQADPGLLKYGASSRATS